MEQKELRKELAKLHTRMTYLHDEATLGLGAVDSYAYVDDIDEDDDLLEEITKAELVELVESLEDRLESIDDYVYQACKRLENLKELAKQLD